MWMASAAKNVNVSFTAVLPSNEYFEICKENEPFCKHVSEWTGQGMKYEVKEWENLDFPEIFQEIDNQNILIFPFEYFFFYFSCVFLT